MPIVSLVDIAQQFTTVLLTLWANKDKAERVGHTPIISLVDIAQQHVAWLCGRQFILQVFKVDVLQVVSTKNTVVGAATH